MAEVILTSENFKEEVLDSELTVLVDFWAPWCGPCRMVGPAVSEIAKELAGKVKVCKLNVDEAEDVAGRYGVMSIPTLMVFKNGEIVNTAVGARSKDNIIEMLGE